MSAAGEFIDAALQRETAWTPPVDDRGASGLRSYGASVGAVRGTVRDASRKFRGMSHDEVTALASELWDVPVFERRLAAVVLLQSNVSMLDNFDLTRIEGFIREGRVRSLVDPLATDVVGPMIERLDDAGRSRALATLDRWIAENNVWLRRAAILAPLRPLRSGQGDTERFARRARAILAEPYASDIVNEAIDAVLDALAK
ncbi:DNA alkylation repair protein [Mycetocola sp.]|jgi:3-methyladenine DNA glycosylase AlkD|uniref:DNA alkylation repair protein n=1 Tax=Mycetocola sp. TaxID=1871042 RepID=UPI00260625FB|nr:DNA alkylation repair protein [Mycetocola sp.]MCU1419983.1 alkylation repair protein [Mycetocola sp.]MCU1559534.1 alkylation repair protein [Mycetocola sp.]